MDKPGNPSGGDGTGALNDAGNGPSMASIEAAMMEELGFSRIDALPLADSGPDINITGAARVPRPRQLDSNNPWQNFVADDLDATTEGLDDMHGGMLYRIRRGASTAVSGRGGSGINGHMTNFTSSRGNRGSRGRATILPTRSQAAEQRLPAYMLDARRQVNTASHIDSTIARLRATPSYGTNFSMPSKPSPSHNPSPAPASSPTPRNGSTASRATKASKTSAATRGGHQQASVPRLSRYGTLASTDVFMEHLARTAPKKSLDTTSTTSEKPKHVGLAQSQWADQEENSASVDSVVPVTSARSTNVPSGVPSKINLPELLPAVTSAKQVTVVGIPQAMSTQLKPVAEPVQLATSSDVTKVDQCEEITFGSTLPASVSPTPVEGGNTLATAGRIVLQTNKVKCSKNEDFVGYADATLYKNDEVGIAAYLEIIGESGVILKTAIGEGEISKELNKVKKCTATLRYIHGNDVWRIVFQHPLHATNFENSIVERLDVVDKLKAGLKEFYSNDPALQAVSLDENGLMKEVARVTNRVDPEDQKFIERAPSVEEAEEEDGDTQTPTLIATYDEPLQDVNGSLAHIPEEEPTVNMEDEVEDNLYDAESDYKGPTASRPQLVDVSVEAAPPALEDTTSLEVDDSMVAGAFEQLNRDPNEPFLEKAMRIGRYDGDEAQVLSGISQLLSALLSPSPEYQLRTAEYKASYCMDLSKKLLKYAYSLQSKMESDAVRSSIQSNSELRAETSIGSHQSSLKSKMVKDTGKPSSKVTRRNTTYVAIYSEDNSDGEDQFFNSPETQSGHNSNDSTITKPGLLDSEMKSTSNFLNLVAMSLPMAPLNFSPKGSSNNTPETATSVSAHVASNVDESAKDAIEIAEADSGRIIYQPLVLMSLRHGISAEIEQDLKNTSIFPWISPGKKEGHLQTQQGRSNRTGSVASRSSGRPGYRVLSTPAKKTRKLAAHPSKSGPTPVTPSQTGEASSVTPSNQRLGHRTGLSQSLEDFHLADKAPEPVSPKVSQPETSCDAPPVTPQVTQSGAADGQAVVLVGAADEKAVVPVGAADGQAVVPVGAADEQAVVPVQDTLPATPPSALNVYNGEGPSTGKGFKGLAASMFAGEALSTTPSPATKNVQVKGQLARSNRPVVHTPKSGKRRPGSRTNISENIRPVGLEGFTNSPFPSRFQSQGHARTASDVSASGFKSITPALVAHEQGNGGAPLRGSPRKRLNQSFPRHGSPGSGAQ